jgi:hypothetical protein
MNISDKALEMIIRDVMGGMEELANLKGYEAPLDCMEILSIEPVVPQTEAVPATPPHNAVVLPFPVLKKTA